MVIFVITHCGPYKDTTFICVVTSVRGDHFLENLGMSGNVTTVRENQELTRKKLVRENLFIVNIMFGRHRCLLA